MTPEPEANPEFVSSVSMTRLLFFTIKPKPRERDRERDLFSSLFLLGVFLIFFFIFSIKGQKGRACEATPMTPVINPEGNFFKK